MLIEARLEPLEQREGVGGRPGEARQHPVVVDAGTLGGMLDDRLAEACWPSPAIATRPRRRMDDDRGRVQPPTGSHARARVPRRTPSRAGPRSRGCSAGSSPAGRGPGAPGSGGGPPASEHGRERVTQGVGRDPPGEPCGAGPVPDDPVKAAHRETPAPMVPEERAPRTLAPAEVRTERLDGLRPGDHALLSTLAQDPHAALRGGRRLPDPARRAPRPAPRWRRGPPGSRGPAGWSRRRPEADGRAPRSGRSGGGRQPAGQGSARTSWRGSTARALRNQRKKLRSVARRPGHRRPRRPRAWRSARRLGDARVRVGRAPRPGARGSWCSPRGPPGSSGRCAPRRPFGHEVRQERRNGRPFLLVAGRLHALSISRR